MVTEMETGMLMAMETLIPWAYARCRFLVISESTRDDLVARGIDCSRIEVVHCGVDHERYRVDAGVAKAPAPTLAFVGRLRRYKGVDWVLRALPGWWRVPTQVNPAVCRARFRCVNLALRPEF